MEEESTSHPPAQLWHQEGAQQLSKAEPRRSKEVDAALATDHVEPPFLRKRSRVYTYFPLRTFTSTSSHQRAPAVSFFFSRARSHCRSPPCSVQTETMSPSRSIRTRSNAQHPPYPFAS